MEEIMISSPCEERRRLAVASNVRIGAVFEEESHEDQVTTCSNLFKGMAERIAVGMRRVVFG
jgi:hypothetical protein